ncbi:MAG: hypothetical protein GXP29_04905, partial [Planctomycetes bacterium]|nr:hypothetical protein [Planctomycetota bacterium]
GLAKINSQYDVRFGDGERKLNIKTVGDGEVLDISQDGDGPITVKRYVQGQENDAEEAEYADADALEAADTDAFELYDQQGSQAGYMKFKFGDDAGATFSFDAAKPSFLNEDLYKRLASELKALPQVTGTAGQVHSAIARLHGGHGGQVPGGMFISAGAVMQSFRVNPDGEIEVTLRKGDTEIVNVYSDANDLEARNPEAFSKYSSVLEATNE